MGHPAANQSAASQPLQPSTPLLASQREERPDGAGLNETVPRPATKPAILLVVPDDSLRETLQIILRDEGYPVVSVAENSLAWHVLQLSRHPFLVFLTHGGYDGTSSQILQQVTTLPPHAYLLLSTRVPDAPTVWNPHLHAPVPVIACPFDLDGLLVQVKQLSHQLATINCPEPFDSALAPSDPASLHVRDL